MPGRCHGRRGYRGAPARRRGRARCGAARLRAARPGAARSSASRADGARIRARRNGGPHHRPRRGGVLAAERTALNLVSRMSGVATATRALADAIAGTQGEDRLHSQDDAGIACARKGGGPARRGRQPPVRPRRRDADQGQPYRACRRGRARRSNAPRRTPGISSRSSSRSTHSISSPRRSKWASMRYCSTT